MENAQVQSVRQTGVLILAAGSRMQNVLVIMAKPFCAF